MSREFYQGLTIEIFKRNGKWIVVLNGEEDSTHRTKAEAKTYINHCIKSK